MIYEGNVYNTYPGAYCLSNCVCNYMNYLNLDITEVDLLLDCDFQVVYTKDSYSIPMLSVQIENSVWDFLKKNNVEVEESYNDQATGWLRDNIKNYSLIIGHLNTEFLTYNPLFFNNRKNYTKHFVNLIGFDDTNGLYISDGYIPTYPVRTFEGWIELEYSDASHRFFKINREQLIKLPYGSEQTGTSKYRDKLVQILDRFLEGGGHEGIYYGYSAYEKYLHDLIAIRHHSIPDFQELFYNMAFYLTSGGVVASKRLLKQFFKKLSLHKYNSDIEKIIRKFELLKLLILKCSFDFQDNYLLDVEIKLSEILQDEIELYNRILADRKILGNTS